MAKLVTDYKCEFFEYFTAQRRELRKIWIDLKKDKNLSLDWELFIYESDLKVIKISDALKISLHEISITYHINEIFKIYDDLYNLKITTN
jgi:hypothetical protein